MRILLSNDDGINSPGIRYLAQWLHEEHEVYISAPDAERSGAGHSFTYLTILRAKETRLEGLEDVPAFSVSGTPADCVKLALGNLVPEPDIVISGINLGSNRGTATFYSGTVAAAMEAALNGHRAIAISNTSSHPKRFGACKSALFFGMELMRKEKDLMLLNINAPDVDENELKGHRITHMSHQRYGRSYDKRLDLHGVPYYWVSTEKTVFSAADADDDERWTNAGYAAYSPMLFDLCDNEAVEKLHGYSEDI